MNDLLNPYIAGAPVTESSMFFGREEVFGWIERSLAGKFVDHILVLHGQRRVGKTSVLKQIPNFLGDKYIQVFFDLQGRTNTTLDRFLWWLAREIARTLTREHGFETPRPDRQAFAENTDHLIDEFFPALQPALGEQVLLLTFDEFDTLAREDIQETLAKPLIAYLRRLMDLEGLNFIFSIGSSGNKLENMQASYTDFFKSALYRKISFLDQRSCQRLITKPVEEVIAYDRRAVDRIYAITAGHPYFTQLICHELFSLCQKTGSRQIKQDNVDPVMEDVIERGTVNLKFVWDEASDLEKWALASLAQQEGAISGHELATSLRQQKVRFVESDLNSALIHLRDKDVLTQDNRFIIYLMRLWLEQNRPLERVREELAEINPIANRLLEIGDEYRSRDQLNKALDSYRDALEVSPGYLKAQLRIAATLFERGTYQEAVIAFEESLGIDPADVAAQTGLSDSLLAWGDQALDLGEIEKAIQRYQRVLTLNQAHRDARQRLASIHSQRAEEFLSAGQDDEALAAFNRALEFTPENTELAERYDQVAEQKRAKVIAGWLQKAEWALDRQAWKEAERFAEEALKLDPDNPELQTKLSDVKDAPRQFQIQTYKRTAEQALDKDKYESAIAALEDAVALAPEDESLANWLERIRAEYLDVQLNRYRQQAQRAIAADKWEAAIAARQEALKLSPDDPELQQELANTETAHRQAQLDALQSQADQAIQEGKWDQAIQAYRSAKELDPTEPSWDQKIEETRAAKVQARLDHFQRQADEAVAQEQWEAAFQAVQEALKIAPDQASWKEKLDQIESDRHQAQLSALHQEAQTSRANQKWDAAIAALDKYLELEPGDAEVQAEIEAIGEEKRRSQLATFKAQAEAATTEERWDDAVQAWDGYLALDPEDRSEIEASRQHARKYVQISGDYAQAQEALRQKNFARAVKLLQGIIAQDPTYKSTTRLLVEAVEAKGQAPIWQSPWVYSGVVAVLVVVLGIIFGPPILKDFTPIGDGVGTKTAIAIAELTQDSASKQTVQAMIDTTEPTPQTYTATPMSVPLPYTGPVPDGAMARLGKGQISAIALSPGGDLLAVAASTGVYLYQSDTLQECWRGPTEAWVLSVVFSPDGSMLASGSTDDKMILWDVETGTQVRALEGHSGNVNSVIFSPDGNTLASGSYAEIILWDVETWVQVHTLERHNSGVNSVTFSPDGSTLASGSYAEVILWDVETGAQVRTLKGHTGAVRSVAYSPDGSILASGSADASVILWDMETGAQVRALKGHKGTVMSLALSPDGNRVASGSSDALVILWDVQTGAQVRALEGHSGDVNSVTFSLDGSKLASGSYAEVFLWNVETGTPVRVLEEHSVNVNSLVFSPNESMLASGYDGKIILWDVETGAQERILNGHTGKVRSVVFSPDGSRVASGSTDDTVILWNVKTGAPVHALEGHTGDINSVTFSSDGSRLASGSSDDTVILWDVETSAQVHALEGHTYDVYSVTFSPDGSMLASGSDDEIILWDVETGKQVLSLQEYSGDVNHLNITQKRSGASVNSLTFSPDGSRLASGSYAEAILWDVETGAQERILEGHTSDVNSVTFSPDGSMLASGSEDDKVILWDVETGAQVRILEGHTSDVNSVTFSSDGSMLASGSDDGTILVWDMLNLLDVATPKTTVTVGVASTLYPSASATTNPEATTDPLIATKRARVTATAQAEMQKLIYNVNISEQEITSISWSPSGDRFAVASADNQGVRIADGQSGELLSHWTDHATDVLIWSPNGDTIVAGNDDGVIVVFDAQSGEILDEIDTQMGDITCMDWSSNGYRLAAGDDEGYLSIWYTSRIPFQTETEKAREDDDVFTLNELTSIAFSPSGGDIVVVGKDPVYDMDVQFRLQGLQTWEVIGTPWALIGDPSWSPHRDYYVISGKHNRHDLNTITLYLNFVETYRLSEEPIDGTGSPTYVSWSKDGDSIASVSEHNNDLLIWSASSFINGNVEIEDITTTFYLNAPGSQLAWSPDSDVLLAGDSEGNVYAWDVSSE